MAQNDKKSANQWSINDLRKEAGALSSSDIPALRTRASGGEARSQFLLGLACEFGYGGVTKDLQQALSGPNSLVIRREDVFPHLVALRLTPIRQSITQMPIRLRVPAGFELVLPAGWEWQEMERDRLKLRIRGASDNQDQALVELWIRRGKDDRGEFEGRATFRNLTWQTRTIDGRSVLWINNSEPGKALWGVIREGDAGVWVFLKHGAAPFARESAEQVFFSLAHAIRFFPASTNVSHPSTGATVEFPAAILPGHPVSSLNTPRDWELRVRSTGSGVPTIHLEWGSTHIASVSITVYPADSSIKDVEAALADITRFFQSKGIRHGAPQSLSIGGGKALWAEAPGTERPWVGAVERGSRIYFVNFYVIFEKQKGNADRPEFRESFLTVLRSVRPGTTVNEIIIPAARFARSLNVEVGVLRQWGADYIHNAVPYRLGTPNEVEYQISLENGGDYDLSVELAAEQPRPVNILVNGTLVYRDALRVTTGGWHQSGAKWFSVGKVSLPRGNNSLVIRRDDVFPHIVTLRLTPIR